MMGFFRMKGIILAGGSGTRLYPITLSVSKQLMPVFDKPLIYYPIAVLMLANIRDILIITAPKDLDQFKRLLADGSQWGISLNYEIQPRPEGLAQAFLIGETFIGSDSSCLILGDNIFFGQGLPELLKRAPDRSKGATIFGYYVKNPERYGVINFNDKGNVLDIEEKPRQPKSNYVVTGLYFYDNNVIEIARKIKPSKRGELEITDINNSYLERGDLQVELMGRGVAWLDTGTPESLLDAANFIKVLEGRQGLKIACLEEIAYRLGYISADQVLQVANQMAKSGYGKYLLHMIRDEGLK